MHGVAVLIGDLGRHGSSVACDNHFQAGATDGASHLKSLVLDTDGPVGDVFHVVAAGRGHAYGIFIDPHTVSGQSSRQWDGLDYATQTLVDRRVFYRSDELR